MTDGSSNFSLVELADLEPTLITRGHLDALVADQVMEGFRLEYKRELGNGNTTLSAVCAMANTFGGTILVGIDEDRSEGHPAFGAPGPAGLIGVEPSERARLATMCSNRLVLPFDPRIHAVPIEPDRVVLVVSVSADLAPRPLTFNDRVYVRTEHGNRQADLFRLRSLFQESPGSGTSARPSLPNASPIGTADLLGSKGPDMVVRGVLAAKVLPSDVDTLLDDKSRSAIADSLGNCGITAWLHGIHQRAVGGPRTQTYQWRVAGTNTSTHSQLLWQALVGYEVAFPEGRCVVELIPALAQLQLTIEIVLRLKAVADEAMMPPAGQYFKVSLHDLYLLLEAMLGARTTMRSILDSLSITAGRMEGPSVGFALRDSVYVEDVIDASSLRLEPSHRTGFGMPLCLDESLHPEEADSRKLQAERWLRRMLLDCHFVGVDKAVEQMLSIVNGP